MEGEEIHGFCQRPYYVEYTRSHSNSEVKRHKARSVLGWGTAWEALRVLLAFCCRHISALILFARWIGWETFPRGEGRFFGFERYSSSFFCVYSKSLHSHFLKTKSLGDDFKFSVSTPAQCVKQTKSGPRSTEVESSHP